jgi:MoxR-like ATPase
MRALDSEENYNLLLMWSPTLSKTLFLTGIMEQQKDAVFFDASNTTNRILDVLKEGRPKIICLDELDKMPSQFQNQLLNFLESGCVKVDKQRTQYDFEIKGAKVFASANDVSHLSKLLQSRFRRLNLPKYTEEQFLKVSVKVCPKLSEVTATMIGQEVWNQGGDIRQVISVDKLIRKHDGEEAVRQIVSTKYGQPDS